MVLILTFIFMIFGSHLLARW